MVEPTFEIYKGFVFYYIIGLLLSGLVFNLIIKVLNFFKGRKVLGFDLLSIYIIQLPLLLGVVGSSLIICKPQFFMIFILIGFIGMAAEAFYSYYWRIFYNKANWIYTIGGIFSNFTSVVNFLAWGAGFMLYLSVMSYIFPKVSINEFMLFSKLFLAQTMMIHLLIVITSIIFRGVKTTGLVNYNFYNFLTISFPILVPILTTSVAISWKYLFISVIFGIFTFVVEYLYGKYMRRKTGKKLWFYNYHTIDNKHTSYTNIFGGITAAYLFIFVFFFLIDLLR